MADWTADIADPAIQGELDGLRLLVESTEGSLITFVRYQNLAEREAGVRYLKEQLAVPVSEQVLSEMRKNPLALLETLPDERHCVQFYDLEEALPEITGYLNINREAYAELPHALVFWVGEHGLREIAQNAPDFWAWRSGVFDVRSEAADLSQSISQVALADDVQFTNRGDLERRAQLYSELIQDHKGEDEEYVVQLRLKLSAIHLRLRNLERAEEEARWIKDYAEQRNEEQLAAQAYHQLGMIAQERQKLKEAEKKYLKSVEIEERLDNHLGASKTYHELGILAQDQQELEKAGKWYHKSLELKQQLNNERLLATTYHQLGTLAQERQEFEEAEQWFRESKEVFERLDDEYLMAKTYFGLGRVAQERRNFDEAEKWYRKSLEIEKRLGDQHGAAKTYHQLGRIAQERRNFDEAEKWHRKSLEIEEHLGVEHRVAETYFGLGRVAQERRNFDEAEKWYRKSAKIKERLDDQHGAAITYAQHGLLARERGSWRDAGYWTLRAILRFVSLDDDKDLYKATNQFIYILEEAPPDAQQDLRQQWTEAGLPADELDDLLEQVHNEKSD